MSTREHETKGSGVEPPVIDLDAEEVAAAAGPSADHEPEQIAEPASAPRKPFSVRSVAVTALTVAAVVAGALAYRSFGERLWPSDRTVAMEERLATLDAATRTLTSQITAIGAVVDELKASNAALPERVDKAQSAAASASERLTAIGERLDEAEADLGRHQELIFKMQASSKGPNVVGAPGLDALAARVAVLEEAVAALKSAPPPPTHGEIADTALLSQALADLKANVASGAPYEEQSRTIARLVPGIAGLDRLLPYAATGLPTAAQLGSEIESIAVALPAPETGNIQTADSGYWSGISNLLSGIVTIRTIGESDWKEVAAKVASDIRTTSLAAAVARLDAAEGSAPPPIEEWRVKAKARLDADSAVDEASAAVLRVLSASTGKS